MIRKEIRIGESVVIVEATELQIDNIIGVLVKISSSDEFVCIWGHKIGQLKLSILEILKDYFHLHSKIKNRVLRFVREFLYDFKLEF